MKKILLIIFILSLVLSSCNKEEIIEKKFYKTYTVNTWSLSSKDSIVVTLEWKNTSFLSFKTPWRISEIYVKKWDKVKAWDILAKLWNEESNITYRWLDNILVNMSSIGVDISSIWTDTNKMKSAIEKLYDERLKLLQDNYEKAKIATQMKEKDLNLAIKTNIDSSTMFSWSLISVEQKIKQASIALKMATNNLENSTKLLEQEKLNIRKNALNALNNTYIIARNSLDYIDSILGVTNLYKNQNDGYEIYLGAKKTGSKINADNIFRDFNVKYLETQKYYQDNIISKTEISEETIKIALEKAIATTDILNNLLHATKDVLDNSIPSSILNEEQLWIMKIQISTLLSNLEQTILSPSWAWIKWSQESILSFQNNYNLKIKQLEDARDIAEEDFNLAKTSQSINASDISKNRSNLDTSIKMKEDELRLSKIWEWEVLKNIEIVKHEKASKISEINANLSEISSKLWELNSKKSETSMNKSLASESIESWIIRAPFDGIVLDKLVDKATVVWAGNPVLAITSSDKILIKTYLDNSLYNKKVWDSVKLFNPKNKQETDWVISLLDLNKDLIKAKNYIEIELSWTWLIIWDRTSLLLSQDNKIKKSILIPSSAVIYKYSQPWVLILENKIAKFKFIKVTWNDEEFTSIEWLETWEKVITEGKDNIIDWEELK